MNNESSRMSVGGKVPELERKLSEKTFELEVFKLQVDKDFVQKELMAETLDTVAEGMFSLGLKKEEFNVAELNLNTNVYNTSLLSQFKQLFSEATRLLQSRIS